MMFLFFRLIFPKAAVKACSTTRFRRISRWSTPPRSAPQKTVSSSSAIPSAPAGHGSGPRLTLRLVKNSGPFTRCATLRRFSNYCGVLRGVQRSIFLRKMPLKIPGTALHQLENRYNSRAGTNIGQTNIGTARSSRYYVVEIEGQTSDRFLQAISYPAAIVGAENLPIDFVSERRAHKDKHVRNRFRTVPSA